MAVNDASLLMTNEPIKRKITPGFRRKNAKYGGRSHVIDADDVDIAVLNRIGCRSQVSIFKTIIVTTDVKGDSIYFKWLRLAVTDTVIW